MYLEKTTTDRFRKRLAESGREDVAGKVTPEFLERLSEYYSFLHRWNKKINLTRVFSSPVTVLDEFLLSPAWYAMSLSGSAVRILDVGSGNGIPAIFCSLLYPDKSFVLCEIDYKKAVFLQELKRSMNLLNVEVRPCGFEDVDSPDGMGFHVVMFKNVSKQGDFLRAVGQLLAPGGRIVFQTGPENVENLRKKNDQFRVDAAYNIPVTKKTCLVELSIVPRETI